MCVLVYDCGHVFSDFSTVTVYINVSETQTNRLKGKQCKNMLLSQSLCSYSCFCLPHIPLPTNVVTMCGNLFDPYHAEKQMSWNATDTACE